MLTDPRPIREIADSIVECRPRWMTYDDGQGRWRCMVIDEQEAGQDDLSPGGTMLRIEADAGCRFGVHNHYAEGGGACTEVFTVVEGLFDVEVDGEQARRLSPGDTYRVPPGAEHHVHAVTACVVWAASIPTARGYGYVPTDIDGAGA